MFLKFKRIRLVNFLSFGDEIIDLNNPGYTIVKGLNINPIDNASSNGSGKSSIWEALSWCLTGETIRGSKDIININSTDGAFVELIFDVDNIEYKIIRSKEHSIYKTNLRIWINGIDKSGKGIRDSEKLLTEYLPDLTSQLIGSVIILGQGLPQRFTNNTPSGRKEILEKLSKSDFMIEDLKTRISNRKVNLSKQLREFEDAILILTTEQNIVNDTLEVDNKTLESINSSSIESLIENKNTLVESNKDIELKIEQLQTQYSDLDVNLNSNISNLTIMTNDYNSAKSTINADLQIEYNDLYEKLTYTKAEIKTCSNTIKEYKAIKDVCPTCGQKLQGVVKPSTSAYELRLTQYNADLVQLEDSINKVKKTMSDNLESVKLDYETKISSINAEINRIKHDQAIITSAIKNHRETLNCNNAYINSLSASINDYETRKQSTIQRIQENTEKLSEIDKKLLYNHNKKLEIQNKLDVINKMNTIITRDFRGYLLINVINFINNKSKEYSRDIFNTDRINFVLDKNNISISYDGKEYENLSGGEKQKVDLIVQFAIRDMLCKFLDFSSNLIVLDELFDNLDSIGCQKVLNLISSKLSDVESIYIVTHHADIAIPIDRELTVVKGENKISFIQ